MKPWDHRIAVGSWCTHNESRRIALHLQQAGVGLCKDQACNRCIGDKAGIAIDDPVIASASVKGHPNSSSFAIGKFGLIGLAQSLARKLQLQNSHVGHFVIDGGIALLEGVDERTAARGADGLLNPDAIAQA